MFKRLLGKEELKIVNLLLLNENVLISGISNVGVSTMSKGVIEKLEENNILTISLFSYELTSKNITEIETFIVNRIKSSYSVEIDTFNDFFTKTNYKLVIIIDRIDSFDNSEVLINFLSQLRTKSFYKVTFFASVSLSFFNKAHINYSGYHKIIFKGFREKYNELLNSFINYYDIPKINAKDKETIEQYTCKHTGLTKSVLLSIKNNNKLLPISQIFKNNDDLVNRCESIINDLKDSNINTDEITNGISDLENLGLAENGKICSILLFYLGLKNTDMSTLTNTEEEIYNFLDKINYKKVDEIAEMLNSNHKDFETTDWTVYKHINNINKKLKENNIKIVNRRGKGYKLV